MKRRHAFTLTELLIVVSIISVLATIALPTLNRAVELARRTICGNNLSVCSKAMFDYAGAYDSWFPTLYVDYRGQSMIGSAVTDPVWDKAKGKGNSCNMYALVRLQSASMDAFVCPSTEHTVNPNGNPLTDDDFRNYKNVSYSLHAQRRDDASPPNAYPVKAISTGGMAFMADRSPLSGNDCWKKSSYGDWYYAAPEDMESETEGGIDEYQHNSFNHGQEGQNVAFLDTHVIWCTTPLVGVNNDNIWTWNNGTQWGTAKQSEISTNQKIRTAAPANDSDSLLFP